MDSSCFEGRKQINEPLPERGIDMRSRECGVSWADMKEM